MAKITPGFRLSPQQEQAWFAQKQSAIPLNVCGRVDIHGEGLTPVFVHAAVEQVAASHEILRTVYERQRGMKTPFQVILESLSPGWGEDDLRGNPVFQHNRIEAISDVLAHTNFNLDSEPVLAAHWIQTDQDTGTLVLSAPAIALDLESLQIFAQQVVARMAGEQPALELMQYADVTAWEHALLEAGDEQARTALEWWATRKQRPIAIPLERDSELPFQASRVRVPVDASRLQEFASQISLSPEDALFACWQIAAWRWSSQLSPLLRRVLAGRGYDEVTHSLGAFARSLPMEARFHADYSFVEVVGQAMRVREEAEANQEYYQAEADDREAIVFQCFRSGEEWRAGAITATFHPIQALQSTFRLQLSCDLGCSAVCAWLWFDIARLTQVAAESLAASYAALLQAALDAPETSVELLETVGDHAQRQMLVDWNATKTAFPRECSFDLLFHQQALRTPARAAVMCQGRSLSYGELDAESNRIAAYLRESGLETGDLVGLLLDPLPEVLCCVLGIMKAGGAFVMLNPDLPEKRLEQQLQKVSQVIAGQRYRALPSSSFHGQITLAEQRPWSAFPGTALGPLASAEDLAYVIYTSGSTGVPKAVGVRHRNLINYSTHIYRQLELESAAPLQFATVSTLAADLGNTCIFPALIAGGCVHLVPYEVATDADQFAAYNERHAIDVLKIVPSHISALFSCQGTRVLPRRFLLCGGEALSWTLADRLRGSGASCELFNHYGPTETTVGSLMLRVSELAETGSTSSATVPIGRPIANTEVYILDERRRLVLPGVVGELYIAGEGVSAGYLGEAAMTAERFVENPFAAGSRMYRTGDLARWLEDGCVEFLGRVDDQVKLRGFRIEPGEIASAIEKHPGISQAAVIAVRDQHTEENVLVAHAVRRPGSQPTAESLRQHLRELLPEYMIPRSMVFLHKLPLTANGKLDRASLPSPVDATEQNSRIFIPPRTPTEEKVAAIWAELLHLAQVGAEDGFFDLGGHSLLATQMISRIRRQFEVELPLLSIFEAATVGAISARIDDLREAGRFSQVPALQRRTGMERVPLSHPQRGIWFLDQLRSGSSAYNRPWIHRILGPLDRGALELSFAALVERHEVLRTVIESRDGVPSQAINPDLQLSLQVVDLQAIPASEQLGQWQALLKREAETPFSLASGPLLRARLIELGPVDRILVLNLHHIITDGWSFGILAKDLSEFYKAFSEGRRPALEPLPIQYSDFAAWQCEALSENALEQDLTFWKKELAGAPPVLELPADHARAQFDTATGATVSRILPPHLTAKLAELGRAAGASLFMALLAGFEALVARYTGKTDFVIGMPVANRDRRELEGIIGMFANTVALRADLEGDPTFLQLLERVRRMALAAYSHQNLPFERLVEELSIERSLSHHPVFQIMFVGRNGPTDELELPGLEVSPIPLLSESAKFDLTVFITETRQGTVVAAEYNTGLFHAATAERMLLHYEQLLAAANSTPVCPTSQLPMLSAGEFEQLLHQFNHAELELPPGRCIHQYFERQADETPEATALLWNHERICYAELNLRSNRLAHQLIRRGIKPETRVGVFLDRTPEMVIALLAVLKAGGAYVPLDPNYPKERLGQILQCAKPAVVLTESSLTDSLPRFAESVLCIDSRREAIACEPGSNPEERAAANNLAYILFTSGSTGVPKGVAIEHRNMVTFLEWCLRTCPSAALAGVACGTSICFDMSTFEIFVTLAAGGSIVLLDTLLSLSNAPAREQVTCINTVPSAMAELLRNGQAPGSLKMVLLAGEAVPNALVEQIYSATPAELVINSYGPTENGYSTWSQLYRGREVHIGRPLPGIEAYVLDRNRQPVPIGVLGELYLAGRGLARGYFAAPEKTEERFLTNPFKSAPGTRVYKTGDLCRWRKDGQLEYLGRIDDQVKLRGYRVELGEIESVLMRHTEVENAVAMLREDRPGDMQLVAYIVSAMDRETLVEDLMLDLQSRLPGYMVPSQIVRLSQLPFTPNGKVDRGALPVPNRLPAPGDLTPRTPTEQIIAGIWEDVLSLPAVNADQNFFALGGHSLLATRVIARIGSALGVEVPLRTIFATPTVAALARAVEQLRGAGAILHAPPIRHAERGGPLPLSFAQLRYWFLHRLAPQGHAHNVKVALRLACADLDVEALSRSVTATVERHEVLRTQYRESDGIPQQWIVEDLPPNFSFIDMRGETPRAALQRAEQSGREPFDLENGPVCRFSVIQIAPQDYLLMMVAHHICMDGWSAAVVFRDLSHHYDALVRGSSPNLAPLAVQYADYAVWERRWLQGEVLQAEVDFWREALAGAPPQLLLPTDDELAESDESAGGYQTFTLPNEIVQTLKAFCQLQQVTLFTALLWATGVLLQRWTGEHDMVVGTVVGSRPSAELDGVAGCFLNMLPLKISIHPSASAAALLKDIQATLLDAFSHRSCPLDAIVAAVQPERSAHANPLYNVGLLLQNFSPLDLAAGTLHGSFIQFDRTVALLDLRLVFTQKSTTLEIACEYKKALFQSATITALLSSFEAVLGQLLTAPENLVEKIALTDALRQQAKDAHRRQNHDIAICSTFPAEALEAPLRLLLDELGIGMGVRFAGSHQAIAQLLDPASVIRKNSGFAVLLIRLEDLLRHGTPSCDGAGDAIRLVLEELAGALRAAAAESFASFLVCFCPEPSSIGQSTERQAALLAAEANFQKSVSHLANVQVIPSSTLPYLYPSALLTETPAEQPEKVPYTVTFLSALGTMIVRCLHGTLEPRRTVIVVGTDGSLGGGNGYAGAADPVTNALREFLLQQADRGACVRWTSKSPTQVREQERSGDHLQIAGQFSGDPSADLTSIAEELSVTFDRVIYMSGSSRACEQVEGQCPGVWTIQLPETVEELSEVLKHEWAFAPDWIASAASMARNSVTTQAAFSAVSVS